MAEQFRIIEYPLLILFVLIGGAFLLSSTDLFSIFLSIELQSYGLYILCTVYRNSEGATSAGLTYFLLGGLSSCFILLASGLMYVNSGNTTFDGLFVINNLSSLAPASYENFYKWYESPYINFSLVILSVGFLFKVSAAPFHFWSPDVYDAIPTVVTTFVAVFAKISIFILLLELVHYTTNFFASMPDDEKQQGNLFFNFSWTYTLLISSLLSLIIGSIVGLTQFRIKRLYAYSTISHIGFILLALSINSIESIQSFIFYLMQYSLSNLNAFLLLLTIGYSLYLFVEKTEVEEKTNEENGVSGKQPLDRAEEEYLAEHQASIDDSVSQTLDRAREVYVASRIGHIKGLSEEKGVSYKDTLEKKSEIEKLYEEKRNYETDKFNPVNNMLTEIKDKNNSPIQLINQMKGYFYINPLLAISLAITLFSFVGIPPLIGFFAKQMVLTAALDSGYIFMALIAILTSVVSAYYYLAVVKQIFFHKTIYQLNPVLLDLNLKATIINKINNRAIENVNIKLQNIVISSSLSSTISVLTLIILFFILIPQEWLNMANILALILFNT